MSGEEENTWVEMGHYADYTITGYENKRRLIDKRTGKIIGEYSI